jgi:monofunctional biosynthetic peptidoglycan transglycosylase
MPPPRRPERPRARWPGIIKKLALVVLFGHFAAVLPLRWVAPPVTFTMIDAAWTASMAAGRPVLPVRSPALDLDALGHLPRAAVAAEDSAFWLHQGFDWIGICSAIDRNRKAEARGSSRRAGGSTIPQQVARNVWLWQERSWLRKGLEAWMTLWLVRLVPRERILELYLQLAQTGPHHFGAQAGARLHFRDDADELSLDEALRLVSVLPSPARRRVDDGGVRDHAEVVRRNLEPWPGEPGHAEVAAAWRRKNPGPLGCAARQLRRLLP